MNRPDEETSADELRGSGEMFDACLVGLRSRGAGILECIKRVRQARGCPLGEAVAAVVNSAAWADQRDAFWQHQWEVFEEILAFNRDRIASIEHTMRPDGETVVVRLKAPPESERGTAEPGAAADGAARSVSGMAQVGGGGGAAERSCEVLRRRRRPA